MDWESENKKRKYIVELENGAPNPAKRIRATDEDIRFQSPNLQPHDPAQYIDKTSQRRDSLARFLANPFYFKDLFGQDFAELFKHINFQQIFDESQLILQRIRIDSHFTNIAGSKTSVSLVINHQLMAIYSWNLCIGEEEIYAKLAVYNATTDQTSYIPLTETNQHLPLKQLLFPHWSLEQYLLILYWSLTGEDASQWLRSAFYPHLTAFDK